MTKYEKELQALKDWDEVQRTTKCEFSGYDFITTAGHGYLIVPRNNSRGMEIVNQMNVSYGFKGELAIYLEEDCEATEFINILREIKEEK